MGLVGSFTGPAVIAGNLTHTLHTTTTLEKGEFSVKQDTKVNAFIKIKQHRTMSLCVLGALFSELINCFQKGRGRMSMFSSGAQWVPATGGRPVYVPILPAPCNRHPPVISPTCQPTHPPSCCSILRTFFLGFYSSLTIQSYYIHCQQKQISQII